MAERRLSRDQLPDVMTADDVRAFLGISRGAAYRLMRQPGFPAVRVPGGWRVSKRAFLAWFDRTGRDGDAA